MEGIHLIFSIAKDLKRLHFDRKTFLTQEMKKFMTVKNPVMVPC